MLVMFQTLLSITQGLHKYLQKDTDLVQAADYKTVVENTLESYRSNEKAHEVYDKTKALCNDLDIPETVTQRKKCRNMEDFVVEASCGAI